MSVKPALEGLIEKPSFFIKRNRHNFSLLALYNQLQILLPEGSVLPSFSLMDQHGKQVSLESLCQSTNMPVYLVFFSSAFLKEDLEILNTCQHYLERHPGSKLVAISGINWETQFNLSRRQNLRFPLLFDSCCRQAKKLGAMWVPKFLNGRALFELDNERRITHATVDPLQFLKNL